MGGGKLATVTDEEKAAAAAAEEKAKEAASAAASELAKRRHEAEADEDRTAPVRMVDLHDLRAELLGRLDTSRRAETVRHDVPAAPAPAAQGRRGGVLPGVLGGALVVVLLLVLAAWKAAKERRA